MESLKQRPVNSSWEKPMNPGFQYFDTSLNKPIWWTGEKWVGANGEDVE